MTLMLRRGPSAGSRATSLAATVSRTSTWDRPGVAPGELADGPWSSKRLSPREPLVTRCSGATTRFPDRRPAPDNRLRGQPVSPPPSVAAQSAWQCPDPIAGGRHLGPRSSDPAFLVGRLNPVHGNAVTGCTPRIAEARAWCMFGSRFSGVLILKGGCITPQTADRYLMHKR